MKPALRRAIDQVAQACAAGELALSDVVATMRRVIDQVPRPKLELVGALELWHAQLSARERTLGTIDDVWRAACCESTAREYIALGWYADAQRELERAAELLAGVAAREHVA